MTEATTTATLSELLVARKHVHDQIATRAKISPNMLASDAMTEVNKRLPPTEDITPLLTSTSPVQLNQFLSETSYMLQRLAKLDLAIQRANWTGKVKVRSAVVEGYPSDNRAETEIPVTQALLRRKELVGLAEHQKLVASLAVYRPIVGRKQISAATDKTAGLEEVTIRAPRLDPTQVKEELEWTSHAHRLLDNVIQQANHTVKIDVPAGLFVEWKPEMALVALAIAKVAQTKNEAVASQADVVATSNVTGQPTPPPLAGL